MAYIGQVYELSKPGCELECVDELLGDLELQLQEYDLGYVHLGYVPCMQSLVCVLDQGYGPELVLQQIFPILLNLKYAKVQV